MIGRDEFLRRPVGAPARAGQAAAARQRRPRCVDRLDRRRTARNFDAGKEHHAWVVWCITVLVPTLAACAIYRGALRSSPARPRVRRRRALPDARLSPVQPLLHRHPRRARARRRARGAAPARRVAASRRERAAGDASSCATSSSTRCSRRIATSSASSSGSCCCRRFGLGPAGAVLYRLAEFVEPLLGVPQRQRRHRRQRAPGRAVAAPVPAARPRAGAPHRLGLRGRRQLRGGGQLLAPRRARSGSTTTRASSSPPRRARSASSSAAARRRASRPIAPRPSRPARCQTRRPPKARRRATPPQLGHLRSVVALVWRSVVLWMLLLALLSLANLVG